MTKTICDICGKEISAVRFVDPNEKLPNFSISSNGKKLDICYECKLDLIKWMAIMRKAEGGEEDGNDI